MRNYEKSYYKTYLDYLGYKETLKEISFTSYLETENINKILATDNDDFVWIFLWEKWLERQKTCFNWSYNGSTWLSDGKDPASRKPFADFNLNPYDNNPAPNRIIPVVDFGDFISFFNQGKINSDFNKLIDIPYDKYFKDLKKFDRYISVPYPELKESMEGIFFDIISILGYTPDEYFSKESFIKIKDKKGKRTLLSYTSLNKIGKNLIQKGIDTLNDPKSFVIERATEVEIYERKILLTETANRIYKLIQAFIDMYADIFNSYQQLNIKEPAQPYQIEPGNFNLSKEDVGSLPIEEALLLSRPKIKPAFKKAYIVRENNLKPFLNIRMEYQIGVDSNDYIDVNYFSIPYNNILSMEHNVKDFNITINLIDTEGNLSELLIQKMYAVSQKKANALVEKNVRPTGEYRFFIEYGWSGPDTDDEDELMEEQVYTKSIHRGYIKSISSQYTFKGTEYTLNIIPNNLSSLNDGFNDTNSLYYDNFDSSSFTPVIGLMVLYLLLSNPADDLYDKIMKWTEGRKEEVSFLEELFIFIEKLFLVKSTLQKGGTSYYFIDIFADGRKKNLHKKIKTKKSTIILDIGYYIKDGEINFNKKIEQLAEKLFQYNQKNDKLVSDSSGETRLRKELTQINFTNAALEEIQRICDEGDIKINAWLAGAYIIWKTHRDRKGKMLLCDNTGLFDIFNKDGKIKSDSEILFILAKFNPYCLKDLPVSKTDGESIYKQIITKNNFNNYYLSQILNLEPDEGPRENERPRPLTFLVKQLNTIFSEMKNIGMNRGASDNNNVYHAADGIILYYDIYKPSYDNMNDFLFEYKRKIYSDRDNIYWSTKLCEDPNQRHEYKYNFFKEKVEAASRSADKSAFPDYVKKQLEYEQQVATKESERKKLAGQRYQKDPNNKKQESEKKFKENKANQYFNLGKEIEQLGRDFKATTTAAKEIILPWPVFYLTYITKPDKVASLNCSLGKKISLLGKQLVQSYSYTPRISPKTRNLNKQFFSQGNASLIREGTGDIIEFSIDPVDIGNFNSIMLANKNKNNVGYNNVSSHAYVGGMYQNAAQYYRNYRGIDGNENVAKIAQDMARLDLNYQSQTVIRGSITIIGEPYWSNINIIMSKCIYIHVYYANGSRCSHSGLYYVSGVVQSIADGKFTTKIDIIRAPTFLSPLEKIVNKNKYIS